MQGPPIGIDDWLKMTVLSGSIKLYILLVFLLVWYDIVIMYVSSMMIHLYWEEETVDWPDPLLYYTTTTILLYCHVYIADYTIPY